MKSRRSRHESTSAESEVSDVSQPSASVDESSDSEDSIESSVDLKRSRRKKKRLSSTVSISEDDKPHHRRSLKKRKHKKKKKKHNKKKRKDSSEESESGEEPSSESGEEDEAEEEEPPAKRKHKHKHLHKSKHSKKGSVRSENHGKHGSRPEEQLSQDRYTESKYHGEERTSHEHHSAVQVENISSSEDERVTANTTRAHRQYYEEQYANRTTPHRERESSRYKNNTRHRTEFESQQGSNRDNNRLSENCSSYTKEREHSVRYQREREQVDTYSHKYLQRQYENVYDGPLSTNEYQRAAEYPATEASLYRDGDNTRDYRSRHDRYEAARMKDITRLLDVEIPHDVAYDARTRPEYNVDEEHESGQRRAHCYNKDKVDRRRTNRPVDRDSWRRKPDTSESQHNERERKHPDRQAPKQDSYRIRDETRPVSRTHCEGAHRGESSRPSRKTDSSRNSRPAAEDRRLEQSKKERHESRSPRRPAVRESGKERDRSPKNMRNEEESRKFEWGGKTEELEKKPEGKEKPNFGLSGKLAEDTNTVNGVVLKYSQPDDAKQPKRKWRFYPFKGEQALPILYIHRQSAFLLGRDKLVADIPLDHPSISKQHAALQYRCVPFKRDDGTTGRRVRPYIIDLESANGTFVNNKKIESRKYVELLERDVVKFGFSQREYVLLHENSKDDACDDDLNNDN